MSASSKKKLRNAEQAEKMTEKQLAEQKEAKKLKLYTTLAVVILIALVVFAAYIGISRAVVNSGIRERNTVALTIGDQKISNAEFNYYYIDAVNDFYSQFGNYASVLGLDLTKPLNEQIVDEDTQKTWADDFIQSATDNVCATYALVAEAKANGFTLPEDSVTTIDNAIATMNMYATIYGYPNGNAYIKAMYGNGADEKSLREYYEMTELARTYQLDYQESLTYTDDQLRAAEAENFNKFSSYNYNYYYLTVNSFLETNVEEATAEQKAAAVQAAEEAAKSLTDGITTVEAFDAAIAALSINADKTSVASYASEDTSFSNLNTAYADWMADPARKTGNMTYVPYIATSTDENGNEIEQINGYYVVMFGSCNDNTYPLANVRHILVKPEGGTYNSNTGMFDYTEEEKAAARAEAEAILNEWKSGDATEESFAALANEKSDDGDGTTGGLYEDVYPGQMVAAFEDWCFDNRKAGDTGIVETEYGCHVMFYSGDSETSYRDHLISGELAANDFNTWYAAIVDAVTPTGHDFKYIKTDLVLGAA